MVSPQNPRASAKYRTRDENYFVAAVDPYNRERDPTTSDIKDPQTGRHYPIHCEWRNNTTDCIWKLIDISNNQATWVLIACADSGPIIGLHDQVDAEIFPDDTGFIDIDGLTVANAANPSGIPLETVKNGADTMDLQIQVSAAITGAPSDKNDAGLASFDDEDFTVTEHGYVSLKDDSAVNTVQTTDATPTTLGTLAITDDTTVTIKGFIAAQESDFTNRLGGEFIAIATASSGTASIELPVITNEVATFSTATFSVTASGANAVIQVTGEAATTINWTGKWSYTIEEQ